jgi:hypothetical protein
LGDDGLIIADSWSEVEAMDTEELELFTTFEDLPDDLFDYAVDLPEEDEIALMETFDPDLMYSLDPYTLDDMINALLEDGIDADSLAEMSDDEYYQFLYDSLAAADPALGDTFYEAMTYEDVDGDGLIAGFDADAYYAGDDVYGYSDEFEGMDFSADTSEETPIEDVSSEEEIDAEPTIEEPSGEEQPPVEEPPPSEGAEKREVGDKSGKCGQPRGLTASKLSFSQSWRII